MLEYVRSVLHLWPDAPPCVREFADTGGRVAEANVAAWGIARPMSWDPRRSEATKHAAWTVVWATGFYHPSRPPRPLHWDEVRKSAAAALDVSRDAEGLAAN